ncbi:flagellar biosynthetic protein FliO [Brevibacillus sp. H7]|uniref:flagellar biosynthetic protein FliO n=1 Tax=Brevibacillus sp. H7 TaxID=3349138 RepID=UPI00380A0442
MMMHRKAGARLVRICCLILLLFASLPPVSFAEEKSAWDAIVNGGVSGSNVANGGTVPLTAIPGSDTTGVWGYLLQVVFSLGVIVVCIFLLLRFLGKRQLSATSGPIKVIGAVSLGNGKTLQIVMIGDSLYLLGVGENVQLLRHIPSGEEADVVLAELEMKPVAGWKWDWLPFPVKKNQEEMLFTADQPDGSFEELLNKQWREVNRQTGKANSWTDEKGHHRGDPS